MEVDLSEVALDPGLGQCYQVLRQAPGKFGAGAFVPGEVATLNQFGIVSIASPEALQQVPEADRVEGSIQVITNFPLYETLEDRPAPAQGSATSDVVVWQGLQYRVQSVAPWLVNGFVSAICSRKKGS